MPSHSRLSPADLTCIALFAVLMAVCSWITVPFTVPFTLQTFALFLALLTLGGKRTLYAAAVYLLMGAIGLPVFSGFQGGPGVLLGPSGGYLLGFPAASLIFRAITCRWGTARRTAVPGCLAGLLACYALGTLWFLAGYAQTGASGLGSLLSVCVLPFLLPDLAKLALALWIAPRLRRHLK